MKAQFEKLNIYKLAEKLSDNIWDIVSTWDSFTKNSMGFQIIKSCDSIGANIAEGNGRATYNEKKHFARIARGSLCESIHWLRRAFKRKLLNEKQIEEIKSIIDELSPKLNAHITSLKNMNSK
jgi:four helix bundle protein